MKTLFSFLLFLFLVAIGCDEFSQSRQTSIESPTGSILVSVRERNQLDYFFRELIIYSSGGYTFYGTKPVSFESVVKPVFQWDIRHLWHAFFPSNIKKYRAWQTWQKYQHHFPSKKFLIWSEPSPWIPHCDLIIIANLSQVERVLSTTSHSSSNLDSLHLQSLFREALQGDDELLGILCGYGSRNARLFNQKQDLSLKPLFSAELDQLFSNTRALLNYVCGWPYVEMEEVLMYPAFMADLDSQETQWLRTEYLQTRQQILAHYEGRNFFEATTDLFMRK